MCMRKEYDFSGGKRGPILKSSGKTRVTMYLDNHVIEAFRAKGDSTGRGYQTLINEALGEHIARAAKPVDARTLRRILREELKKAG